MKRRVCRRKRRWMNTMYILRSSWRMQRNMRYSRGTPPDWGCGRLSKYSKEIAIGAVPVVLIFLLFIKVNVMPVVLIGLVLAGFYLFMRTRSGETLRSGRRGAKAKSPS